MKTQPLNRLKSLSTKKPSQLCHGGRRLCTENLRLKRTAELTIGRFSQSPDPPNPSSTPMNASKWFLSRPKNSWGRGAPRCLSSPSFLGFRVSASLAFLMPSICPHAASGGVLWKQLDTPRFLMFTGLEPVVQNDLGALSLPPGHDPN